MVVLIGLFLSILRNGRPGCPAEAKEAADWLWGRPDSHSVSGIVGADPAGRNS